MSSSDEQSQQPAASNSAGRIAAWSLAILAVLLIVSVGGGLVYIQTDSFQRLAVRTIVQDVNQATGGRAEIGGLDFQLSTLTAHLQNITIHGTEAAGEAPLLHIDHLIVGLKILSFMQRKVSLDELVIDHPAAHLLVDSSGKNNIPQAPPSRGSSNSSVFDLAVHHVLLENGQLQYNDQQTPLDADLYNLKTEVRFQPLQTRYDGTLSYSNGGIRYQNNLSLPHSLEAKFNARPDGLLIESAVLKFGSSSLSLNANLSDYGNLKIDGRYDLRLSPQDFSSLSKPASAKGELALSGTARYRPTAQQSPLKTIALQGNLAAAKLELLSPQGRLDLHNLHGSYELANGRLQSRDLSFEALGGSISSIIDLQNLDATMAAKIQSKLQGISLEAAQRAIPQGQVNQVALSGRLGGTVEASWNGSFNNLVGRSDVIVRNDWSSAARTSAAAGSNKRIPLTGQAHAVYDRSRNSTVFRDTIFQISGTTVSIQGEMSNRSNLKIQANAGDLHSIASLASALGVQNATSLAISGSAALNVTATGPIQNPQLTGNISTKTLSVQGSQWSTAQAKFQASASGVVLQNVILNNAHQGKASLDANIGLRKWRYLPTNEIAANATIEKMSIADLQRLANVHYPVSGDLSASLTLKGTQLNPVGRGSAKIDNAKAYDQPIQQLSANFTADRTAINSKLDLSMPAGAASGTISYAPATKTYTIKLDAPSIVLQKLQAVQAKNLSIDGVVTLTASGRGTVDDPQLEAVIAVPQLQMRDRSASQMKAVLHVANHRAEINLDSEVAHASVHSHANIALTGDYEADAVLDTSSVSLEPLIALFSSSPPQGFKGETELHATLKGPLKDKSRIEAHVTIPVFKANYQALEIGAASPIHADYVNSVVTLQPAEIRGTGTSLKIQGKFPLAGSVQPTLSAQGSVDARIAKIFSPDTESSGSVAVDIHASGSASNPQVEGQIHVKNVAFSSPGAPLGVQNLNGSLAIVNNTLQLSGLTGDVGGGTVSAGGTISYRPDLQFNVSLTGNSVRLRYPEGVRAMLDGNLMLSGTKDESVLSGRVLIDSLSFTPDFDLSKFSDQFGGSTAPSAPGLADNIRLQVGVQSKNNLSAISSQVSIDGEVNLQAVGTVANPVITGRTDLTSGELFYRNVRYQLQRGVITFDNPSETNPVLNVTATTTIQQYNLTLTLRGPFDKLTTIYTSDPPLATADVINLIANGQTTSQQSAAGTSTDSILASQVAGQVTGGIQHLAGISSLQIDPLLGGNQNPSAKVALQQRVSKNFLFTFSTDLSQPGSEIVAGDYQINKRWSVTVTRDEVGGISVDGKYHTRF